MLDEQKSDEQKVVYLNVFKSRHGLFTIGETETRQEADDEADALTKLARATHVGRMRIVLEEGRWDE